MQERIGLVVGDKNPLVLKGLGALLAEDGRFEVLASVSTGEAFLDAILTGPAEIGVIGWLMPDMRADEVLREIHHAGRRKKLVVYTGARHPEVPRRVMALGGFGFCSKSEPPEFLIDTLAAVSHGRISFPYVDVRSLYADPFGNLTARERELLEALARGWTNQQIASRYGISENTVKFHLKNLYDKLDVTNRAMAVALYMEHSRAAE